MKISEIVIGERFRKEFGDVSELAKSISEIGLLHPIVITEKNELIAGVRRLKACEQLGWAEVPTTVVNIPDIKRGEYDENVHRKGFLPTEIAAIAKALRPKAEDAAKKRQVSALKQGDVIPVVQTLHHGEEGKTRDKVAAFADISGFTLEKIEKVVEAAEEEPEKYKPLVEEMDKKGKVDAAYRKLEREKKEEQKREQFKESNYIENHIIHGDAIEILNKISPASFDLLLTDPPYSTETENFEAFLKQWVSKAAEKIKDTGRIYIFTGSYINELSAYINAFNSLNNGFKLSNLLVWHYQNNIGPTPKLEFKRGWQGIFYLYGKNAPPLDSPLTKDLFDHFDYPLPDGRQEIKYHSHQKPEKLIEQLIVLSSKRGDRILDLFAGSGTIGLAASKLERYCLSIEKEKENAEICKKRGLIAYER